MYFCMKLIQYDEYWISTVDTDGLVLQHQGISSHIADYAQGLHTHAFPAIYELNIFIMIWEQSETALNPLGYIMCVQ